jgi:hypothetical protein
VGQVRRVENAKILVANTPMDTDKIKIYGSRVSKMNNPLFFLSFLLWYFYFYSFVLGHVLHFFSDTNSVKG